MASLRRSLPGSGKDGLLTGRVRCTPEGPAKDDGDRWTRHGDNGFEGVGGELEGARPLLGDREDLVMKLRELHLSVVDFSRRGENN